MYIVIKTVYMYIIVLTATLVLGIPKTFIFQNLVQDLSLVITVTQQKLCILCTFHMYSHIKKHMLQMKTVLNFSIYWLSYSYMLPIYPHMYNTKDSNRRQFLTLIALLNQCCTSVEFYISKGQSLCLNESKCLFSYLPMRYSCQMVYLTYVHISSDKGHNSWHFCTVYPKAYGWSMSGLLPLPCDLSMSY